MNGDILKEPAVSTFSIYWFVYSEHWHL